MLLGKRAVVIRGREFDRWDLEVRGGLLGSIRVLGMVEEHGAANQLFRLRAWPYLPLAGGLIFLFGFLAALAAYDKSWIAVLPLALGTFAIAAFARAHCATALRSWSEALDEYACLESDSADLNARLRDTRC